ncbi:MAG: N-acetylneuraminate synthase, partial [Lachnospiraceae bacterium]|nr:N-acetylneuraminate synthase [Lachnospiraceae bacterium]
MKTLIIAEAGVNHNGSLELAKEMVDMAARSGADIVKFQTARVSSVVSKFAKMAEYQKKNTGKDVSQKEMLEKIHLPFEAYITLKDYCQEKGIGFLSTPFDMESVLFLDGLQDIWKIPSGEITNYPYLVKIAQTGKPVILSTGMAALEEVKDAVDLLKEKGTSEISLLHCTTEYPAPFSDVNLKAMETLRETFHLPVGYSDHTEGIAVSIAAVAMGAAIIEKHFTLDKTMEGPDHKASLEPSELAEMVRQIRNVEEALGTGEKLPAKGEIKNIEIARKSIIAARDIKKGEI